VDTLCLDNARATAVLIQYLHRLGHRRIAYANHSLTTNAASRIGTWRATLRGLGVAVPDGYLMTERVAPGSDEGYEIDAGRTLAKRLLGLPDPPTAIVGGNDLIAAGIIVGAKEIGFRVPADVSVVGYDDLAVGRVTDPTLTTMVFPKAEMGRRAFDLLINRSPRDGGAPVRQLVFEFDLLVRESSETAHS
jgi:LacI family transcriptional regulator